ncbi:MAG: VOC family protein [Ktedonobacteraceae bacterium]
MNSEIGYLHHVGHVVRDMEQARDLYRQLGFICAAPAYPTLSPHAGEPARPFGAANTHANFSRNFVEILAVVTAESHIPDDAHPVQLQVPPSALPQVVASIERTIAKISASLARFEGIHILVLQTEDAGKSALRFDQAGVGHSGVNMVQMPIESATGQQLVPMGVVEIDREDVPEGRLAVAENRGLVAGEEGAPQDRPSSQHPNGAVDLVESILCTPDAEIAKYVERYQRYLGRPGRSDGAAHIFDLRESCLKVIPASALEATLPDETAPLLPAFVAYAVVVHDLDSTRRLLESNGVVVHEAPAGDIFVPARAALGAAVIFRQAR